MLLSFTFFVIPAKAGIQGLAIQRLAIQGLAIQGLAIQRLATRPTPSPG